MTKVVIFDVDGTLMNVNHRRHYVNGPNKDWKAFNEAMVPVSYTHLTLPTKA